MTAYVIGKLQIHDRSWMEEYFSKVPRLVEEHGGRFLVRGGNAEMLEGVEALPDAAVLIEFPDRESAKAFWGSDTFQTLAVLRRSGSTLNAMLVNGLT